MHRTIPAALAVVASLAIPAVAQAKFIQVGETGDDAPPSCPTNTQANPCQAIARTTGYQVRDGAWRDQFVVPEAGRIVAWRIQLSQPTADQVRFFDRNYGSPSARLTILRPGRSLTATVVAQSPSISLAPYFGQTIDVALDRTLAVRKGQIVALTVPTWAPALATQTGRSDVSWRASRSPKDPKQCGAKNVLSSQSAQTRVGRRARYGCLYQQALITYSATLVTRRAG